MFISNLTFFYLFCSNNPHCCNIRQKIYISLVIRPYNIELPYKNCFVLFQTFTHEIGDLKVRKFNFIENLGGMTT